MPVYDSPYFTGFDLESLDLPVDIPEDPLQELRESVQAKYTPSALKVWESYEQEFEKYNPTADIFQLEAANYGAENALNDLDMETYIQLDKRSDFKNSTGQRGFVGAGDTNKAIDMMDQGMVSQLNGALSSINMAHLGLKEEVIANKTNYSDSLWDAFSDFVSTDPKTKAEQYQEDIDAMEDMDFDTGLSEWCTVQCSDGCGIIQDPCPDASMAGGTYLSGTPCCGGTAVLDDPDMCCPTTNTLGQVIDCGWNIDAAHCTGVGTLCYNDDGISYDCDDAPPPLEDPWEPGGGGCPSSGWCPEGLSWACGGFSLGECTSDRCCVEPGGGGGDYPDPFNP